MITKPFLSSMFIYKPLYLKSVYDAYVKDFEAHKFSLSTATETAYLRLLIFQEAVLENTDMKEDIIVSTPSKQPFAKETAMTNVFIIKGKHSSPNGKIKNEAN